MALEPGTVYEAERTGSSLGLFTVNSALHSHAVNAQTPWIGTGKWVPGGSESGKTAVKAETVPVGIDNSDEPPRLTRDPQKQTTPTSAPASTTAPAASAAQSSGQSSSGRTAALDQRRFDAGGGAASRFDSGGSESTGGRLVRARGDGRNETR